MWAKKLTYEDKRLLPIPSNIAEWQKKQQIGPDQQRFSPNDLDMSVNSELTDD